MCGTRASRRQVKRSLKWKETPPVRAGFFISIGSEDFEEQEEEWKVRILLP